MILKIQLAQHQVTLHAGNNNMNKYLGVTLIELLVTVALIAILAGISIANMKTVQRSQELVDNATTVVENLLNQANTNSITLNNSQAVCNLTVGTGSGSSFSTCDATATTWINVNGNVLPKVRITISGVTPINGAPNNEITYTNGLVSSSTKATITITSISNTSCYNVITVWPNGILDIDTTNSTSTNCLTH